MKKPRNVADLADRLTQAATAPLMAATPLEPLVAPALPAIPNAEEAPEPQDIHRRRRKPAPKRSTKTVYLRVPAPLYEKYDSEAVRRTKATGRGVTVQQVILDHLAGTNA